MAILICLKKVKRREKGLCACMGGGVLKEVVRKILHQNGHLEM